MESSNLIALLKERKFADSVSETLEWFQSKPKLKIPGGMIGVSLKDSSRCVCELLGSRPYHSATVHVWENDIATEIGTLARSPAHVLSRQTAGRGGGVAGETFLVAFQGGADTFVNELFSAHVLIRMGDLTDADMRTILGSWPNEVYESPPVML